MATLLSDITLASARALSAALDSDDGLDLEEARVVAKLVLQQARDTHADWQRMRSRMATGWPGSTARLVLGNLSRSYEELVKTLSHAVTRVKDKEAFPPEEIGLFELEQAISVANVTLQEMAALLEQFNRPRPQLDRKKLADAREARKSDEPPEDIRDIIARVEAGGEV